LTALLKLTLVFAGIVLLLNRKWNLGLVLLLASVAVGLLFSYPLLEVGCDVLLGSIDLLTLRLALVVVLIMVLGELLRQTAGMKGMIEALQALIPDGRIVIAVLPALIGLLPMVGGAMFSAPMVDEVGGRLKIDGARKTFVNYWFRHVWEPVFPLHPSMVLAAGLLDLTLTRLIAATWPVTAAAAAGGLLFGLLGLPRRGEADPPAIPYAQSLRTLASSIWPVVMVIVLPLTVHIDERFDLIFSLLMTIALMMAVKRVPLRDLWDILYRRVPWHTVVIIFGALIFRRVLENSGAVLAVSDALANLNIPLAVVTFAVPFIPGLLTGLVVAGYGIGFPVVLPLVLQNGGAVRSVWAAWLVAGGFMGVMCSPMHLCLALTRVYFKAGWGAVYRLIVPSALLVVATVTAMLLLA
jgi:integral membrane protein (TIGR00529 family)